MGLTDQALPDTLALLWFCQLDLLGGRDSLALENREYLAALRNHRVCTARFIDAARHLDLGEGCQAEALQPTNGDDAASECCDLAALEILPWPTESHLQEERAAPTRFVALILDAFDLAGAGYPLELVRRCAAGLFPAARVRVVLRFIADTTACWVPEDVLGAVDLVWVPSAHSAAALPRASSGRGPPMPPVALVPEVCRPPSCAPPGAPERSEAFVFLAIMNDYGLDDQLRPEQAGPKRWNAARKNLAGLLQAFAGEFAASDGTGGGGGGGDGPHRVELLVKSTRPGLRRDISAFLSCLGAAEGVEERIRVEDRWLPDVGEFLRRGHCLVAPSRGEGWCRCLAEALRAGFPVIASDFGGHTDYVSAETGFLVATELVDCPFALGLDWRGHAQWAEVDLQDLRRVMRHVVKHYDEALRRAQTGMRAMSQRCSPAAVAAALADAVLRPLLLREESAAAGAAAPRPRPPPHGEGSGDGGEGGECGGEGGGEEFVAVD